MSQLGPERLSVIHQITNAIAVYNSNFKEWTAENTCSDLINTVACMLDKPGYTAAISLYRTSHLISIMCEAAMVTHIDAQPAKDDVAIPTPASDDLTHLHYYVDLQETIMRVLYLQLEAEEDAAEKKRLQCS